MRNIWMSRLGRASTIVALAGIAIAATGLGATSAEAREYGYWDRWGYHHYYSHPWWGPRYYGYNYGPRYYYGPPAYAYSDPYYYGPPAVNFSIGVP